MEWRALGVIVMMLTALIPFGLSNNGSELNGLMETLDKAHMLAEEWVTPLRDQLGLDSPVLKTYTLAEEYREKAIAALSEGDEDTAREYALEALHNYRLALEGLKESKGTYEGDTERIKAGMERLNTYFSRGEALIRSARKMGLDTSRAEVLLKETKALYLEALTALKNGEVEKARNRLDTAEARRKELDTVLEELRKEAIRERERHFVEAFLVKTGKGLKVARNYLEMARGRGVDVSRAEEKLEEVESTYAVIGGLAKEGRWDEALRTMKKNAPLFAAFFGELGRVEHRVDEKSVQDIQKFQKSLTERIRKDTLALQALKKRGVNTAPAEIMLRNAVMEAQVGRELLKRGQHEKAKEHFLRSLALLKRVEAFVAERG